MTNKCYNCETKKASHKFSCCLSATCSCPCVNQIYKMGENLQEEGMRIIHPNFLAIDNAEIKTLPNQDKDIKSFNEIRKDEWLPKKKDKRFRKK